MNDTLLGIILGGVIATIPSICTLVANAITQHQQQKHELHLKRIELYETDRIAALSNYSDVLGECLGFSASHRKHDPEEVLRRNNLKTAYWQALAKAAIYVSDSTYAAMLEIDDPTGFMADDASVTKLISCLRTEMRSTFSPEK